MNNSWYVKTLIQNKETIKRNIYKESAGKIESSYTIDFEDMDYNNLLLIETLIEKLIQSNSISDREIVVLNQILAGNSIAMIEKSLGISRITLTKILDDLCDRVAFILGGEFTNEGYLEYMREKYNLTEEQITKARDYMISNRSKVKGGTGE
jgi:hypothetical protein